MLWNQFKKPDGIDRIVKAIKDINTKPVKIMEVCGTHTMAIAKSGIKSLLPENVKLISGPGCPVCVTPVERIDNVLTIAKNKNIIIATYGDMLKVPGSKNGESLEKARALEANVEIVYSAVDAVEIAEKNRDKEIVFLGIGFETTAPGTAAAIETAIENKINNFFVLSMHKTVEPALRALISMDDFDIDGFLCPGNVSVIIGENGFRFLAEEYNIPSAISGFEAGDILVSIYRILCQIKEGKARLENEYKRVVKTDGNPAARAYLNKYFEPYDDLWRGIGLIKNSGLRIKKEYADFDAAIRFSLDFHRVQSNSSCRCGDIIKGKIEPVECNLFGKHCTPDNPVGPCMVSSEGACAAYFKYGDYEVR